MWLWSFLDELEKIAGNVSEPTVHGAPKPPTAKTGKGVIRPKVPGGLSKSPYVPKPPTKKKLASPPAVKPSLLGPRSNSRDLAPITEGPSPLQAQARKQQSPQEGWQRATAGQEGHSQAWQAQARPAEPKRSASATLDGAPVSGRVTQAMPVLTPNLPTPMDFRAPDKAAPGAVPGAMAGIGSVMKVRSTQPVRLGDQLKAPAMRRDPLAAGAG